MSFVKNFAQNDVIFSLNKNSQNNSQNCENNFLVLGEGSSYEKKKKKKVSRLLNEKPNFCLCLNYNGNDSYLYDNDFIQIYL